MSAFLCSDLHLSVLAKLLYENGGGTDEDEIKDNLFELWDQNVRALKERYPDDDTKYLAPTYHENFVLSAVQAIKLIHCYHYQCVEDGDFESSPLWDRLQTLVSNLCSELPGYEEAKWAI